MILYQALSTYQILECIEHRAIYHKDEEATLILGTYIIEKYANYKELETNGFFDYVLLFDFGRLGGNSETIIKEVDKRVKSTLPCDIREYRKIYIAGIHTYLGMYLVHFNIHFSMFEDGSGALSRPWVLADITQKASAEKYSILNKYHLYTHECECIDEKWCDFKSQIEGFEEPKAINFNLIENFEKMTETEKNNVLSFFGIQEKIEINEESVLLLTQQFSNLGQLSFEEHIQIYQNLFDYFMPSDINKVILKLHPDDIMYYKKLFPGIKVIDTLFPSELLPYAFKTIPKTIATITSTGINLIEHKFSNVLKFNELYEKTFKYDYAYYVVANIVKDLCEHQVNAIGVNEQQLENHLRMFNCNVDVIRYEKSCLNDSKVLIIDDFDTDYTVDEISNIANNYNTIIYMNNLGAYRMFNGYNKNIFDYIKSIEISFLDNKFYIWLIDREDKIKNYSHTKDLKYYGGIMEVLELNDKQMEIRRLKGLLAATEKRLISTLEENKELKQKLCEYTSEQS